MKWSVFQGWCLERDTLCALCFMFIFLQLFVDRSVTLSAVKTCAADISSCHEGYGKRSIFTHSLVKHFLKGVRRQRHVMHSFAPQWDLLLLILALRERGEGSRGILVYVPTRQELCHPQLPSEEGHTHQCRDTHAASCHMLRLFYNFLVLGMPQCVTTIPHPLSQHTVSVCACTTLHCVISSRLTELFFPSHSCSA